MVGFSKHINTKQDLLNLLNDYPAETKQWLRDQLTARERWLTDKKLYLAGDTYLDENNVEQTYESDEPYIEDETHRVAEAKDENDVVVQRYQEVYGVDENWYVSAKLGTSYEDVVAILEG